MQVGSQLSSWEGFYADRSARRDTAIDAATRAHFEAELENARITMKAMGLDIPKDSSFDATTPIAPGSSDDTPSAPSEGKETKPGGSIHTIELSPSLNMALVPYREQILAASKATGVPPNLLAAVIWDESKGIASSGTINGENGLTDSGLMQVNPETYAALKSKHSSLLTGDAIDPGNNIMAGALYLKEQYDQFGSWDLALRAYNSGPLSVDPTDARNSTTGLGTKNYVDKVNFYQAALEQGMAMPDGYPGGNEYY